MNPQDSKPGSSSADLPGQAAALPPRRSIPVIPGFFWTSAGFLLMGQLFFLREFHDATPLEIGTLALSAVLHTGTLLALLAIVLGLTARVSPNWLVRWLWSTAMIASTLYSWDCLGFGWLGLHLADSVPLLYWSARSDFNVMGAKRLMMIIGLIGMVLVWFGSPFLAHWRSTAPFVRSRPISLRLALAALGICLGLLTVEQFLADRLLSPKVQAQRGKILRQFSLLPGSGTKPLAPLISVAHPKLRQLPSPQVVQAELAAVNPGSFTRRPNIFLFIVDSLRADAINPAAAPNLARFQQQRAIPILDSTANANCTHISWTTLAHSQPPYLWSALVHQRDQPGALPIRLLHQGGYRIKLWSSAVSTYFGFANNVFGNAHPLLDAEIDQDLLIHQGVPPLIGDLDAEVMRRLEEELKTLHPDSGTLHYVLLDSPHHGYSWGRDFDPPFRPYATSLQAVSAQVNSENVHLLRNRYLNAVNFVDQLLAHFLTRLEALGLLNDAIIVITGDHGEEFLEHGHLVHSSELNRWQLHVPLIVSLPKTIPQPAPVPVASHIDVFPTILDVLGWKPVGESPLAGHSLLDAGRTRLALSSLCSSFTSPNYQLDDGVNRLRLRLRNPAKIGQTVAAAAVDAMSIVDQNENEVRPVPGGPTDTLEIAQKLFNDFLHEFTAP